MMVDTSILVHVANRASTSQQTARSFLSRLIEGGKPWHLTWAILYDFMRKVTDGGVFYEPLRKPELADFLSWLLASKSLRILAETEGHANVIEAILRANPDLEPGDIKYAHTAAVMREHGVKEVATAAGDYHRFPEIRVLHPLGK